MGYHEWTGGSPWMDRGVTMNGPGGHHEWTGGHHEWTGGHHKYVGRAVNAPSKLCYDKLNGSGCHQGLDFLRKRQLYALRLTLWAYFYIWHTMLRPIVMPGLWKYKIMQGKIITYAYNCPFQRFYYGKVGQNGSPKEFFPSFHWLNVLIVGNFDFEVMGKWGNPPPPPPPPLRNSSPISFHWLNVLKPMEWYGGSFDFEV